MRKIPLQINKSKINFVNEAKHLTRDYRIIFMDNIDCSTLLIDFITIFRNAEKITFYSCEFGSIKTLETILSCCKKLRNLSLDCPKLEQIIWDTPSLSSCSMATGATLENLRLYFHFQKTWTILKVFQRIPMFIKNMKLVLVMEYFTDYNEIDSMLKYINQYYQKSLKDLRIVMIYKGDSDFDKVIEQLNLMDDLKLIAFSADSFNDDLFKIFIEKQVHLKYLKLENFVTNIQLELIGNNLCNLNELELTFRGHLKSACISNVINKLKQLKKLTLEAKCGIKLELLLPQNLKEFNLYSHGTFNLTELRLLPSTNVLSKMESFTLSNIIFKNESLQQIFIRMVNLKLLRLSDIHQMTADGFVGRLDAEKSQMYYSIDCLKKLESFTSNTDVMDDRVLMKMKLPALRFLNLEGDLEVFSLFFVVFVF
jgi:hypothetical protein